MDENKLYMKVVDLDEIYNFVVDDFSFEIIYGLKILSEVSIFGNSIFRIVQTKSSGETTKTKVADLDDI